MTEDLQLQTESGPDNELRLRQWRIHARFGEATGKQKNAE